MADTSLDYSTQFRICLILFAVLFLHSNLSYGSVYYDNKALIIDGRRRILISGSIHYPRSTPEMWEDLIKKAKDGGVDVIDTYIFWNLHEPSPGKYNFEGRNDLVRFMKTIQKAGLYAHIRVGPYVCAEWNFGGFPVWLKFVPGIIFRTDNEPFKIAMQGFVEKIVWMMKDERLFHSQGGPIILSQIENEYGQQASLLGPAGHAYMTWAANMAVGTGTGVPWVMCKEADAPDPVINTCNGFYCNNFTPNKPYKPTMWTEAWTGWFSESGVPLHHRPHQDMAFAVTRFIQNGGSFVNYYMYHGGTNFGRTAGGPYVTTSYDYDAPIDEYGLIREPKYSHLKELHKSIKMCEHALVSSNPTITYLGPQQEAHVYYSSAQCAAFLANYDTKYFMRVTFNNMHYSLPPWSISILPDCRNVVFNTAKVGVQTTHVEMQPSSESIFAWQMFNEDIYSLVGGSSLDATGLLEQINMTRDATDYLWYMNSVQISESEKFLYNGKLPTLAVYSTGDALHVFVNDRLSGSVFGSRGFKKLTFRQEVDLHVGVNTIKLLSVAVGLPNVGSHFETWDIGVCGPVLLYGLNQRRLDLSWQKWTYQVGLKGESMDLSSPTGAAVMDWTQSSLAVEQYNQPLTWHKAVFDAPEGDDPLALDFGSMGKGQAWVNGESIGRYWLAFATGNCSRCHYTGPYRPSKCLYGCGRPTQQWYHMPRSWLKPTGNLLVLFEELGGDPRKIRIGRRSVRGVCADVSEYHPMIKNWRIDTNGESAPRLKPKAHLDCGAGRYISSVDFASFGTPLGTCGNLSIGSCHSNSSRSVVASRCVGRRKCMVTMATNFGEDPCPNKLKRLAIEATCITVGGWS